MSKRNKQETNTSKKIVQGSQKIVQMSQKIVQMSQKIVQMIKKNPNEQKKSSNVPTCPCILLYCKNLINADILTDRANVAKNMQSCYRRLGMDSEIVCKAHNQLEKQHEPHCQSEFV